MDVINYLSMLGSKLIHVSQSVHRSDVLRSNGAWQTTEKCWHCSWPGDTILNDRTDWAIPPMIHIISTISGAYIHFGTELVALKYLENCVSYHATRTCCLGWIFFCHQIKFWGYFYLQISYYIKLYKLVFSKTVWIVYCEMNFKSTVFSDRRTFLLHTCHIVFRNTYIVRE